MDTFCLNDTQESVLTVSQILVVRKSSGYNLEIFFQRRENSLIFHFASQKILEDDYKRLICAMCQSQEKRKD